MYLQKKGKNLTKFRILINTTTKPKNISLEGPTLEIYIRNLPCAPPRSLTNPKKGKIWLNFVFLWKNNTTPKYHFRTHPVLEICIKNLPWVRQDPQPRYEILSEGQNDDLHETRFHTTNLHNGSFPLNKIIINHKISMQIPFERL